MAIIGWASLAIFLIAILYLVISGISIFKTMQPKLKRLQSAAERINEQQMKLQTEVQALTAHQESIQQDIQLKKEIFTQFIEEAKQTPGTIKQLAIALKNKWF
ncbi:DUF948 domain-containing protein [Bacillus sp. REN10]|uniref:DUF948 domain-containing protein n=1 Tax=Bacillus sp. REN10 TaxID=2782541 RepID=UPI00193B22CA|nr:DUF948 domain-containing protein [Bacillus sp. REN10]